MAVYFDENGNLVDTEISESSDVLPPNPFLSPGTADDAYANLIGLPANQDMGYLYGVPQRADDQGYLIGTPGTADDVFPFEPPGTADDNIANLIGVPGTSYFGYPNAPANRFGGLDLNKFQGVSDLSVIDETTNDEQSQEYIDAVSKNKKSGIMELIKFLIPGSGIARVFKNDPQATNMRNFYGNRYGLTPTGQIASGIMAGYNPVSGGFLNMITGGKYGNPTNFGLANAARRRIEKIANRRIAQTDASRAKIAALQQFAREDTANRARFNNPNVYASADKQGFTDPSTGGFKSAGTNENFSNKTGRGRTGY